MLHRANRSVRFNFVIQNLNFRFVKRSRTSKTVFVGVYMAFACNQDIISLSCPSNRTINVTSAFYAQYTQACSDTCCPPYPGDCKESMEENAPVDWNALTTVCNNQTSCQFENPGRDVESCEEPYHSNYALIYFSCLPGKFLMLYI